MFDRSASRWRITLILVLATLGGVRADTVSSLQEQAAETGLADWGHWGPAEGLYSAWTAHSNRLIPVYTFGLSLEGFRGTNSVYRDPDRLRSIYGYLPTHTVNKYAEYLDQTDIYRLQQLAVSQGKKHIILFVFDGMDWQTTRAAAIYRSGAVTYDQGRGRGLHFLDYRGVETDYGWMVTSPHHKGTEHDADRQSVVWTDEIVRGGYDADIGGYAPWESSIQPLYLLSNYLPRRHQFNDSASSATTMASGIKTYYGSINVDPHGNHVVPMARTLQMKHGFRVGLVTSVPISHATPAASYANNVTRSDYQDITRDLLGLPSASHPDRPLPGVDVLFGAGWGKYKETDEAQGTNFISGNQFLAEQDLAAVDVSSHGPYGRYQVAVRTHGKPGSEQLREATRKAIRSGDRLLGFFGTPVGNLPFQTADGRYDPVKDQLENTPEYCPCDVRDNPTLAEMTSSALEYLEATGDPFWLLIESGDVDWANHANNIDNSIGSVLSGDAAFRVLTDWVERGHRWEDTAVILTADHGHDFHLIKPEVLIGETKNP